MLRFFWILFALLAALSGAGYWNYQRNAPLDADLAANRPYRGLSDKDLGLLEQAYRDELSGHKQTVDMFERAGNAGGGNYAPSDLQGKVDGFGKAQANAERMRGAQLQERTAQVELEQIARERQVRATEVRDPWARFKRRLLTF